MTGVDPSTGEVLPARYGAGRDLDIATLREQLAPGASIPELEHFARVCLALELSPWASQICLIGRRDRRVGRVVFRPQITVAGRRARAERTGLLDGVTGPEWCGPRRYGTNGEKLPLEWEDIWVDETGELPYAARCLVWRKDQSRPSNGTAKWSEFCVYDDAEQTKLGRFWRRMPSYMLGKVAESIALRRAFPDDLSYRIASGHSAGDDDLALIHEAAGSELPPARAYPTESEIRSATTDFKTGDPDRSREQVPASVYDEAPEARGLAAAPDRESE